MAWAGGDRGHPKMGWVLQKETKGGGDERTQN